MSHVFRLMTPAFLRRLDRYLLLNRPGLWATRLHMVAFWGGLGGLLLLLHAWLLPVSPQQVPAPGLWAGLMVIPVLGGFGAWVYRLNWFRKPALYRSDAQFGYVRDQVVYATVILGLGMIPLLYGHLLRQRVATVTDEETLIADINILNIGEALLEQAGFFGNKVNQSLEYGRVARQDAHYLGRRERKRFLDRTWEPVEQVAHLEAYRAVLAKYSGETFAFGGAALLNRHYQHSVEMNEGLRLELRQQVNRRISRVYSARFEAFGWEIRALRRAWGLGLLGLWLALQLFHRAGARPFLHGLLLGGGLLALAATVAMFANGAFHLRGPEPFFFTLLLGYLGLFAQAYRAYHSARARHWKLMALSLVTLLTPLFPLMMLMVSQHKPSESIAWNALFVGAGIGLVLWEVLLAPRLRVLLSMPQDN